MTGEQSFLRRLRESLPAIGDDAAVLDGGLVAAIDTLVEGVHFTFGGAAAATGADVGWKALAVNLSDLAAMGASPRAALASVALPPAPAGLADAVLEGFMECSQRFGCPLVGGDTTAGPVLVVTVAVLGDAPPGGAVLRSGARPGDAVYVTGPLGGAAASGWRHHRPEPRLDAGRHLAEAGATAMIDVSDGLATDLGHLCEESGVGVVVDAAAVPVAEGATLAHALTGGEDFELCFTVPDAAAAGAGGFTRIGEVVEGHDRVVRRPDGTEEPLVGGWEHEVP